MMRAGSNFFTAFSLTLVWVLFSAFSSAAADVKPLVEAKWLQQNNSNVVILDIRSSKGNKAYLSGHIENAVSAPYPANWRANKAGVPGMMPAPEQLEAMLRKLGVNNDDHLVIAPFGRNSTDFSAATRVYWTLKVLGHDKISILNGGYAAWQKNGGKLSLQAPSHSEGTFKANVGYTLLAKADDVTPAIRNNRQLVDGRPAAQYTGQSKSPVVSRAGTIPTALNLHEAQLYDQTKASYASASAIKELAGKIGISAEEPVIAFCNTGHWASNVWFALSEIAGHENVTMYDGSMAEWTRTTSNPVEIKGCKIAKSGVSPAPSRRYR